MSVVVIEEPVEDDDVVLELEEALVFDETEELVIDVLEELEEAIEVVLIDNIC